MPPKTPDHSETSLTLYLAVADGDIGVVRDALSKGADVNAMNLYVGSPLNFAARRGEVAIAESVVRAGADLEVRHQPGRFPFFHPETGENFETEQDRLIVGMRMTEAPAEGQTPLHSAVEGGWTEVIRVLAAAGAELSPTDHQGRTPLYVATHLTQLESLRALIDAGVNVDARLYPGSPTPLHSAAGLGHAGMVGELIAAGADVNATSTLAGTPLNRAIEEGHVDIALRLIAEGTDVNIGTYKGLTPLHSAAVKGNAGLVKELVAAGADLEVKWKPPWIREYVTSRNIDMASALFMAPDEVKEF